MKPLKPAKTYKEQIEHLRNAHGLIVSNETQAISVLSRTNYYRLSAYGLSLRDSQNPELFRSGVEFRDLYRLYSFDRLLRALLFSVLAEVEIQFRAKVAYQLAIRYGPEGYMDDSHFQEIYTRDKQRTTYQKTIEDFQNEVARQTNLPCVRHHQKIYGGHFPIWAAVELFTFGMTSSLYKCMQTADQEAVAREYGIDAKHLKSWVLCFVEVRNICAHSGRIYNMALKQTPQLYKDQAMYQAHNRLFPVLLALKRILDKQSIWDVFISGFSIIAEQYKDADLTCMGFPDNWREVLGVPPDQNGG